MAFGTHSLRPLNINMTWQRERSNWITPESNVQCLFHCDIYVPCIYFLSSNQGIFCFLLQSDMMCDIYKTQQTTTPRYPLQTHSNSHAITVHQQHRRTPPTKHLQICQIRRTSLLTLTRSLHRTWKRGEHDCRIRTFAPHKFVENQMLGPAGQVVEADWDALGGIS